jgi:hypothetical protein
LLCFYSLGCLLVPYRGSSIPVCSHHNGTFVPLVEEEPAFEHKLMELKKKNQLDLSINLMHLRDLLLHILVYGVEIHDLRWYLFQDLGLHGTLRWIPYPISGMCFVVYFSVGIRVLDST